MNPCAKKKKTITLPLFEESLSDEHQASLKSPRFFSFSYLCCSLMNSQSILCSDPPPLTSSSLLMPEIHFDKDAGWCRQRNPRLAYGLSTWKKLQQLRFSCGRGRGAATETRDVVPFTPFIDSFLSDSFIDVCLVLQSKEREKKKRNAHRLQDILLYRNYQVNDGNVFIFFPTSCLFHLNV